MCMICVLEFGNIKVLVVIGNLRVIILNLVGVGFERLSFLFKFDS